MKKTQKTAFTAAMFAAVLNFTGCGDTKEQPASQVTAPETQIAVSETEILTESETETELETVSETPAQEENYQPSILRLLSMVLLRILNRIQKLIWKQLTPFRKHMLLQWCMALLTLKNNLVNTYAECQYKN